MPAVQKQMEVFLTQNLSIFSLLKANVDSAWNYFIIIIIITSLFFPVIVQLQSKGLPPPIFIDYSKSHQLGVASLKSWLWFEGNIYSVSTFTAKDFWIK